MNTLNTAAQNLEAVKADLIELSKDYLTKYTLSDLCIARSNVLLDLMKPYMNDSLVELEVVQSTAAAFRADPALMLVGSVVKDGVVYPEIEDEAEYLKAMDEMKDAMKEAPAEFMATMAFVTATMMTPYPTAQAA